MSDDPPDPILQWPPDYGAWWSDLKVAAAFLTRLPIRTDGSAGMAALARASRCFPLVGLGIGLAGGILYALAVALDLPPLLAAIIAVAGMVAVTGALHEDGLADVADGFGGGRNRDRKLEIMRDSRLGTYGVCALALSLILRWTAVAAIVNPIPVTLALIAAHVSGRAALPAFMRFVAPARRDGLSAGAGRPMPRCVALAALLGV